MSAFYCTYRKAVEYSYATRLYDIEGFSVTSLRLLSPGVATDGVTLFPPEKN